LNEEGDVVNGLFDVSFVVTNGFADMVAGFPNGEDGFVGANGFEGAGEGDLLGGAAFVSAANRTCLLLNFPREFPLPPLPVTVVPFGPLSCSLFAAFSSRSASKLFGAFSVGDVPGRSKLE
jgi:hypothetical protein